MKFFLEKFNYTAARFYAVFFVEGDKAPDGAFAPVAIAKCMDKPGDIFLFCAEVCEVLRHAQGDQKLTECLNACFCGLFGMVKVHLAAPDADSSLRETHDIVFHDIAENSGHGDRKSGTVGAVTRKSVAETAELRWKSFFGKSRRTGFRILHAMQRGWCDKIRK